MTSSRALAATTSAALALAVGARFHRAPTERLSRFLSSIRTYSTLLLHLYRIWRGGQIRFRLETFGLYYPAPPYQSPWWAISPEGAFLLFRRLSAYACWVEEMETVKRSGGGAWWTRFERNQLRSKHV